METIGERILFLREEQDITQKSLADTVGITPTTLSRYENNKYDPKGEIIKELAIALDTTTDFLIGITNIAADINENSESVGISTKEYRLLTYYRQLNEKNKIRVEERMLTLLENQHYKKI